MLDAGEFIRPLNRRLLDRFAPDSEDLYCRTLKIKACRLRRGKLVVSSLKLVHGILVSVRVNRKIGVDRLLSVFDPGFRFENYVGKVRF